MEILDGELKILARSQPADYSFQKLEILGENSLSRARFSRLKSLPERAANNGKFLTKAVWVNNNRLRSWKNLDVFLNSLLVYPELLTWIDFSFNYIKTLDETILKYPNLKILYLHGNCIDNFEELVKLRGLKQLKTATFHGNPISNEPNYRHFMVTCLPRLLKLDFSPIVKTERNGPASPECLKYFKTLGKKKSSKM